MRIGISALLTENGQSGIGQYTAKLIEALGKRDSSNEYCIFSLKGDPTLNRIQGSNILIIPVSQYLKLPFLSILWHWFLLPYYSWKFQLHLIHLPTHRRLCLWCPVPIVTTIHDFAAIHQPEKYGKLRHFYVKFILNLLLKQVAAVICVSRSTLEDLQCFAPAVAEKACVVYNGLDHTAFHADVDVKKIREFLNEKFGVRIPFILYVARIEHPGKNHIRLIQAFSQLKAKKNIPHSLVLVGGSWNGADKVYDVARIDEYSRDIHFVGFVPDEDLPKFYPGADVVVLPSLWEGFGLPVLEAMACGAPVACSQVGSLPEIAGGIAKLFDPLNIQDIAQAIDALLRMDIADRISMRKRGLQWANTFSWRKTAHETFGLYQQVGTTVR